MHENAVQRSKPNKSTVIVRSVFEGRGLAAQHFLCRHMLQKERETARVIVVTKNTLQQKLALSIYENKQLHC